MAGLLVFILMGPSVEDVKKRFEYYGAPGEIRIMPEISIEDGRDNIRQLPKTLQTPPPPARIEIEPDNPKADEKKPIPRETHLEHAPMTEWPTVDHVPTSEIQEINQSELSLPRQSNPDWYILHQVLPQYPFTASESEQRIPLTQVNVAVFVNPDGLVSEAIIQSATAGKAFTDEVMEKIKLWKFGWRIDPKAGRWIEMTFNFKSPYAPLNNRDS